MYNQSIQTSNNKDYKSILIRSITAAVICTILSFVILCILATILYLHPIQEQKLGIITICCKYFCAIVAAALACINKKHSGYLRGAMAACMYIIVGGILYYSFHIDQFVFIHFVYDLLICGVLGVLCGSVVVNMNSK